MQSTNCWVRDKEKELGSTLTVNVVYQANRKIFS